MSRPANRPHYTNIPFMITPKCMHRWTIGLNYALIFLLFLSLPPLP